MMFFSDFGGQKWGLRRDRDLRDFGQIWRAVSVLGRYFLGERFGGNWPKIGHFRGLKMTLSGEAKLAIFGVKNSENRQKSNMNNLEPRFSVK